MRRLPHASSLHTTLRSSPTCHAVACAEAESAFIDRRHPPFDGFGQPNYDWAAIHRHAEAMLGGEVVWAPVGPAVRRQFGALLDDTTALRP